MKKILSSLVVVVLSLYGYAQAPNSFNYQAVLKNSSGDILSSQAVSVRLSILSGSSTGSVVYSEIQNVTTTASGQINIAVGAGTAVTGTIAGITWGTASYYLKVELDPLGGTAYQLLGTNQLRSTPYTLFSNQVAGLSLSGQNVALGYNTGVSPLYWYSNTFVGDRAGNSLNGGYYNTFIGESSGRSTTSGTSNSFFGTSSGRYNTTGSNNLFFGKGAGNNNTTGAGNTFVGTSSGALSTTSDENTFLGYNTGIKNTTGYRNTFVGAQSGTNNINGSGNVFIGYKSGFNEVLSNKFYLANGSDNTNVLMQGDFSTGALSVKGLLESKSGGIKFPDGTIQTTAAIDSDSQTLSIVDNTISISNGNSIMLPEDQDRDSLNELQTLSIVDNTISISNGNSIMLPEDNDEDRDPNNELQTLSLSGPTLSISNGNSVNLSELPGDNMGDHIATTNIRTNGNWLSNNGTNNGILINSSGKVYVNNNLGIGVQDPASKIQVEALNIAGILVNHTGNFEGMRITKYGNNSALHVQKESGNAAGISIHYAGSAEALFVKRINNAAINSLLFLDNGTSPSAPFISTTSGTQLLATGEWTTPSDSTKKYNIKSLPYGLRTVMALRPVRYQWKANHTVAIGFIAQELKKQIPEIVFGEEGNMSVIYEHMVAVLTKAMQEQQAEIEALKQDNEMLQAKLDKTLQLEQDLRIITERIAQLEKLLPTETASLKK